MSSQTAMSCPGFMFATPSQPTRSAVIHGFGFNNFAKECVETLRGRPLKLQNSEVSPLETKWGLPKSTAVPILGREGAVQEAGFILLLPCVLRSLECVALRPGEK